MRLTPAQHHWQKHAAQSHAAGESAAAGLVGYERIRHRLQHDRRMLKGIQSTLRRAEIKRELLPHYQGWIDGTLEADSGRQDEVFITCLIWALDAGLYDQALPMAAYAIRHRLNLPDGFRRTTATMLVDEICDAALTGFKVDAASERVPLAHLRELEALTDGEDMPDEVRAKLFKTLAFTLRNGELDQKHEAVDYMKRATELHDRVGVLRDIRDLESELKRTSSTDDEPEKTKGAGKKAGA
ncbi:phage terminase small subunit [Gibbsiella dentisursi]|uniref:Phage terminase small subunit n=1 Tax=Gibbsiella dentisursi TaxID=796890 RepID=A0ABP7M113_9GAMM